MLRRRQAPKAQARPYTIVAQDGDDDDGGTVYYLYDDLRRVIGASAWPQPLEEIAHITGHPVLRATWGGGADDGIDDR
jgi:hypothetical protein